MKILPDEYSSDPQNGLYLVMAPAGASYISHASARAGAGGRRAVSADAVKPGISAAMPGSALAYTRAMRAQCARSVLPGASAYCVCGPEPVRLCGGFVHCSSHPLRAYTPAYLARRTARQIARAKAVSVLAYAARS